MFKESYTISEIGEVITSLPDHFDLEPGIVFVMQSGKAVMTILPTSTYKTLMETIDSLLETLEVMKDEELMAAFRQGVKELESGEGRPWEEVKRELGLE